MQASTPVTPPAAEARPNLFLRNDTFLGVCEAIGENFGFHANGSGSCPRPRCTGSRRRSPAPISASAWPFCSAGWLPPTVTAPSSPATRDSAQQRAEPRALPLAA